MPTATATARTPRQPTAYDGGSGIGASALESPVVTVRVTVRMSPSRSRSRLLTASRPPRYTAGTACTRSSRPHPGQVCVLLITSPPSIVQ
ncbi:hypothetical protein ACWCQ0_44815 [Streptomyces massasporeus]